jgi:hypothetical protein
MKLEELLQIESFQIGDKTFESTVEDDLNINSSNLDNEFCKHPKLMAIYGFAYEQANSYANKLEVDLERMYAALDHEVRVTSLVNGEKVTEKIVENKIIIDERYLLLQNKLLDAQAQAGMLKAAKDAVSHKRDMIIQIGSLEKALIKSDPTMRG